MKTIKEKTKRLSKKDGQKLLVAHDAQTDDFVAKAISKERNGKEFEVTITFKPMQGFGGGLRSEWFSGETDTHKFGLDSGAGLGNALLTMWIESKETKKREYFTASMPTAAEQALEKLGVR